MLSVLGMFGLALLDGSGDSEGYVLQHNVGQAPLSDHLARIQDLNTYQAFAFRQVQRNLLAQTYRSALVLPF